MSSSRTLSSSSLLLFFIIQTIIISILYHTSVSASDVMIEPYFNYASFKYVNDGEFGDYIDEYDTSYRHGINIFNSPFQLFFYNATPNTYYVGLRVGTVRSTSVMRWVWDFNRGNPVKENATFSLGSDGNLVVADVDGRVAFQSGTANKGVKGFKLLPNGNMVLYDAKGNFLWQSFDRPTDTLLVGQSLRVGSKLVSRTSPKQNTNGPYSLIVEPKRFAMYYQSKNSPKPLLYFQHSSSAPYGNDSLEFLKLNVETYTSLYTYDEITLDFKIAKSNDTGIYLYLGRRLRYNATVTYLRLGIDGTLKAFTFDRDADIQAWAVTFDLFSSDDIGTCQLPERCGKFGLCEKGQCVACPSPNGLLGWSKDCKPPKLTSSSCNNSTQVKYYKIVGVDHFVTKYTKGEGPMKEDDCSKKCTSNCKCAGYFYQQDKSMCWVVNDLMTLTKVEDKKHLGYIKF